jgi:hypothetical protein
MKYIIRKGGFRYELIPRRDLVHPIDGLPIDDEPEGDGPAQQAPVAADKTWVEIQLVGEDGSPVPGIKYEITVPGKDQPIVGTLDEQGVGNVEGIDPGTCTITFPELDKEAWEPAS